MPTIDKLHEDFERIVKCYAHGKKLFVFIDDLDRCDVPKSAEMMQAVNLLLSDSLEAGARVRGTKPSRNWTQVALSAPIDHTQTSGRRRK